MFACKYTWNCAVIFINVFYSHFIWWCSTTTLYPCFNYRYTLHQTKRFITATRISNYKWHQILSRSQLCIIQKSTPVTNVIIHQQQSLLFEMSQFVLINQAINWQRNNADRESISFSDVESGPFSDGCQTYNL